MPFVFLGVPCGPEISRIDAGQLTMVYGGMTADHDASNSQYALPYELSIGEKGNLLYDGKKDNTLTGTWYLARKDDSDDSSGGCNAGFGALALLAAVAALRKKR